ncbi:growth/differentiation factor 10-like [Limulus polyphemus]|uniref:Growth/differentiation factor 10-like n=1 Tax=Limulus polyphemus TaxID=6850 RepID=A0ABM1T0C6_LIMPO|nr:growth/differentiation factor 10-like [Limulus polyphemus]
MLALKLCRKDQTIMICVVLILELLAIPINSVTSGSKNKTEILIKKTMLSQQGVKIRAMEQKRTDSRLPLPPRYMLDLYARYRSGQYLNNKNRGDTVRSILPKKGKLEGKHILIFNLSGIHPTERILNGELHIPRRWKIKYGKHQKQDSTVYHLVLIDYSKTTVTVLEKLTMDHQGQGWQNYDVTKPITACHEKKTCGSVFAMKLEVRRSRGKYKTVNIWRIIRKTSKPFLIIFSEDDKRNETIEDLDERFLFYDNLKKSNMMSLSYQETKQQLLNRSKRSTWDNELPIDPIHTNKIPDPNVNAFHSHTETQKRDPSLIPYPEETNYWKSFGKSKGFKRRNRKKRRRKNRKLPHFLHPKGEQIHENDASLHNKYGTFSDLCRRRKLRVNFADIGWSRWIIAPTSLEVHFCSGHCPFPLTKNFRPSNHATIQSIVNAIGLNPGVPAPCCVPDSLSSVTLLYFDEDENVVLKNYPNMSVQNCACR